MKRNAPFFIHFFLILALSLYSGLAVTHATTPETDNSPSQPGDETPSQPRIQVESPNVTDLAHGDEDWLPVADQTTTVTFKLRCTS